MDKEKVIESFSLRGHSFFIQWGAGVSLFVTNVLGEPCFLSMGGRRGSWFFSHEFDRILLILMLN